VTAGMYRAFAEAALAMMLSVCAVCISVAQTGQTATGPAGRHVEPTEEEREKYGQMVEVYRDWQRTELFASGPGDRELRREPVKVRLTSFTAPRRPMSGFGDHGMRTGVDLSHANFRHGFFDGPFGSKGGWGSDPLPAADAKRLDEILANLPPDDGRRPPEDFRILVQADEGESFAVRLYDRRHLPDEIVELLRLTKIRIYPPSVSIGPDESIAAEFGGYSAMCLAPDGRSVVVAKQEPGLEFWDMHARKRVKEVPDIPGWSSGLSFSPDGDLALLFDDDNLEVRSAKNWKRLTKLRSPRVHDRSSPFLAATVSPDGRHVLAATTSTVMLTLNTTDWSYCGLPDVLPATTTSYFPMQDNSKAVIVQDENSIDLWDLRLKKAIARLDSDARLIRVAYSPDGRLVAVGSSHRVKGGHWTRFRIRIASTESGNWTR
jgi:hypothetical protein